MHKLLIIDDDDQVLVSLKRLLFDDPYEVDTCNNPLDALTLIQQNEYSLIITDMRMPNLSGVELLETPDVANTSAIKIIISGFSDLDSVVSAINCGHVWRYIQKPWSNDDFKIMVSNAIDLFEERKQNKQYQIELIKKNKELVHLNANLKSMVLERTKLLEEHSRLLQLMLTNKDKTFIIKEILKSINENCGPFEFSFVSELTGRPHFIEIEGKSRNLGFIEFNEVTNSELPAIQAKVMHFLPVMKLCLYSLDARNNTKRMLSDLHFMINETENG